MQLLKDILNFILESYANIAAILVGCMITSRFLPRRPGYALRVTASFIACGVWMFLAKQWMAAMPQAMFHIAVAAFTGLFALSGLAVMFWHEATWHQALFAATVSYALQNMCERLIELPMLYWPWFPRQVIIPLLILVLWLYSRFCERYRQKQAMVDFTNVNSRMLLLLATVVLAVCVVIDLVLKGEVDHASMTINACICALMALFSFLTVVLSMSHLRESDAKVQAAEAAQLLRSAQRQYAYDRQIHEAINVKCHDIRHQIAAIRSSVTDNTYRAELKEIGRLVDIYDTTPHSHNAALDVVLAGKMLTCNSLGITITCMADGRRLDFIEDGDVYALFGNILDNAIEAVSGMEDASRRMITLTVGARGGFLVIECENFFEGTLTFEDGLPQTTKADRMNHGFGSYSIRMLAEKYEGTLQVSAQDDIFSLSVLIPIPESA